MLNPHPYIHGAIISTCVIRFRVRPLATTRVFSGCRSSSVGWIISPGEPYRPSGLQYSCSSWIIGCVCDSNDEVRRQPHPYPHGPSVPRTLARCLSSTDNPMATVNVDKRKPGRKGNPDTTQETPSRSLYLSRWSPHGVTDAATRDGMFGIAEMPSVELCGAHGRASSKRLLQRTRRTA